MLQGKFITIEGADGAGKSTQLAVIQQWLERQQIDAVFTREPGGTDIGERLRSLLLGEGGLQIGDDAELLMVFAARVEHLQAIILPALKVGKWVVSDRFTDASYAYQGARGISVERIQVLENWAHPDFQPDLTLLFDLPVETGLERVGKRGEADRFEQESIDYKKRVRQIYLDRAEADMNRIKVVDSRCSIVEVSEQVLAKLSDFIRI